MPASILAWQFKSGLSLMEALLALQLATPQYGWQLHDSDAMGRYLLGVSRDGVKVKIYQELGELEAWLPPDGANASAVSFAVTQSVLPAIQAEDVVRD